MSVAQLINSYHVWQFNQGTNKLLGSILLRMHTVKEENSTKCWLLKHENKMEISNSRSYIRLLMLEP